MSDRQAVAPTLDPDVALRHILEGTAAQTRTQCFESLVGSLALTFGTSAAWVTEFVTAKA